MDELLKSINQLIEQKTFNLEAVETIKKLRDRASDLEKKQEYSERRIREFETRVVELEARVKVRDQSLADWEKRREGIAAREKTMEEHERRTAVAEAQSGVYRETFGKVFGNTIIRESIQRSASRGNPHSDSNKYNQTLSDSETVNTETVKE